MQYAWQTPSSCNFFLAYHIPAYSSAGTSVKHLSPSQILGDIGVGEGSTLRCLLYQIWCLYVCANAMCVGEYVCAHMCVWTCVCAHAMHMCVVHPHMCGMHTFRDQRMTCFFPIFTIVLRQSLSLQGCLFQLLPGQWALRIYSSPPLSMGFIGTG